MGVNLNLKYRPQDFDTVLGQHTTIKILEKQLSSNNISNCYLFVGNTGCGKTTIGRILANKINNNLGFPIEIDAASHNGVDDIRAIINEANTRATDGGEYKIFIIDECHAITTQGWQAFLKCIEEPPKYTIFIFCTTNPTKVPLTIQNRIQKFILTKVNNEDIKNRLKEIATNEKINISDEALEFITKVSNGCVRQAITNLETCIHYADALDIKTVIAALGNYAYDDFFKLTNAIIDGDEKTIFELIHNLYYEGKDLSLFVEQYLEFCLDLSRYYVFKSFKTLKIPESMQKELEYTTGIENGLKFFNNLVDKVLDLKFSIQHDSNIKNTVEAYLIRICRGK